VLIFLEISENLLKLFHFIRFNYNGMLYLFFTCSFLIFTKWYQITYLLHMHMQLIDAYKCIVVMCCGISLITYVNELFPSPAK